MSKINIISDKNKKSLKIKSIIEKKLNQVVNKKLNIAIVIGVMDSCCKLSKKKIQKNFYGINSGNYGFLMNKFSSKNTIKYIQKLT